MSRKVYVFFLDLFTHYFITVNVFRLFSNKFDFFIELTKLPILGSIFNISLGISSLADCFCSLKHPFYALDST